MSLKQKISPGGIGEWRWQASLGAGLPHPVFLLPNSFAMPSALLHRRAFLAGHRRTGRDRFARLLYGTRVSLLLAPAAALLATLIAGLDWSSRGIPGRSLGANGHHRRRSVPLASLVVPAAGCCALCCRSTRPRLTSVIITFLLLGCLGWAGPARMLRAAPATLVNSDFLVQASASGISRWRLFWRHLLPNLRPTLACPILDFGPRVHPE